MDIRLESIAGLDLARKLEEARKIRRAMAARDGETKERRCQHGR